MMEESQMQLCLIRLARNAVLACAVSLVGCASTNQLPTLGAHERVRIVSGIDDELGLSVTKGKVVAADTKTGAKAGMVVGAVAGLSCGPLAVLCVPLGAIIYGAQGGAIGLLVGAAKSLPSEKTEQLSSRLEELRATHDFQAELLSAVTQGAARR